MLGYYLKKGAREPVVTTLKRALNRAVNPSPKLDDGTLFDEKTRLAVISFQKLKGTAGDGVVGPTTWALLGQALSTSPDGAPVDGTEPQWIQNLLVNDPRTTVVVGIDTGIFFDLYELSYGKLGAKQREGLTSLITAINADVDVSDLRWAAYMLATVKHECANTWQPIEEYGKGAGRPYGNPVDVTDAAGKKYTNTYYGRGYVQLTWKDNYANLGKQLGLGDALLLHPEKALERDTAYAIMSYGMRNGSFTAKALPDYIKDATCDYKNARRIINGLDQWERIKGYAEHLQTMLLAVVTAPTERAARGAAAFTGRAPTCLPP
jgi:peptidoglycan hydrolase-like protein with peptidoglycan-binding domain